MRHTNNGIFEERQSSVTFKEKVSGYLSNWPFFAAALVICLSLAIFYIRYTVPKYIAFTSFLVKGGETRGGETNELIDGALNGNSVNLGNEILQISSSGLMERAVRSNGDNISYYKKGRLHDMDINKQAPFTLIPKQIIDSTKIIEITIPQIDISGGSLVSTNNDIETKQNFQWGKAFKIDGQTFVLVAKKRIEDVEKDFHVRYEPVEKAANRFLKDLVIKPVDARTSVIQLSITSENLEKGISLLNSLFQEFSLADVESRKKVAENTVNFIDERLIAISAELKGVEGNLETYQGSNLLVDLKSQSTQLLGNSNELSKTINELEIKQGVVNMILEYFANPNNAGKLVPSSLGLNDATLESLITQYNELQLRKGREEPRVAKQSTVMVDLNTQIENLKASILESLNNINKNLSLQSRGFRSQNREYLGYLSTMPHNERVLQEIKRKQGITEGLYLYLLQKREETAISSTAAQIVRYKQIDLASGYGPVEPNAKNIIIISCLLAVALAVAVIYLKNILNNTVKNRDEIQEVLPVPILGDISLADKSGRKEISNLGKAMVGEQLRNIRTKLSFLVKTKSDKVILVTSSNSGEGKTFISQNLAAIYAIPGKKVALLNFDLRNRTVDLQNPPSGNLGLADFLSGKTDNLSDISQPTKEISSLYIFRAGAQSSNPTDLMLSEKMDLLFTRLKEQFDYIVIDSSPAGIVSDAYILGRFSDIVLYVIRKQKTDRKELIFIKEVLDNKTLQNVGIILNGTSRLNPNQYITDEQRVSRPFEKLSLNFRR